MEHILTLKKYVSEKKDIPIEYFNAEFLQGKRILDPWQRLDGWNLEYKESFIKSVLHGNDIPKIMQYTLKGDLTQKQRILDGGHRTRCISEYIKGEFGIKINEHYYWWEIPRDKEDKVRKVSSGKNVKLPQKYKDEFMGYTLSVTTYKNLTDKEAREKFNELNHCNPMDTSEVINSHSSLLIDMLRKEWSQYIDSPGSDDCKKIMKIFHISKKDMESLKYMKIIVSLFSLIERKGNIDLFNYCQPSDALNYVRGEKGSPDTNFEKGEFVTIWSNFTSAIEKYKTTILTMYENGFKLDNHSEALTYFQFINNEMGEITEENIQTLCVFSKKCNLYRRESPQYENGLKNVENKSIEKVKGLQESLNKLKDSVGPDVVKWITTFKNNGSGKRNLGTRSVILKNIIK